MELVNRFDEHAKNYFESYSLNNQQIKQLKKINHDFNPNKLYYQKFKNLFIFLALFCGLFLVFKLKQKNYMNQYAENLIALSNNYSISFDKIIDHDLEEFFSKNQKLIIEKFGLKKFTFIGKRIHPLDKNILEIKYLDESNKQVSKIFINQLSNYDKLMFSNFHLYKEEKNFIQTRKILNYSISKVNYIE
jgi:hypothetical protein